MSTQATYLPLAEQNFPAEHAALAQTFHTSASWVWTREDEQYRPPYAPPGAVRAFRWTYPGSRSPSSITIIVSADNYFSLHVNGVLVQAANPSNDLLDAHAFTVPIPAGTSKTVVAVRAFNADDTTAIWNNPAGFTSAIKLSFQGTAQTETFVTGSNTRWVGTSTLVAGWESPSFDDSNWANVVAFPAESYHGWYNNDDVYLHANINTSCDFGFVEYNNYTPYRHLYDLRTTVNYDYDQLFHR
ncbi:hypothetical protein MD484_g8151, partial [Candolleomyces efflorescens]